MKAINPIPSDLTAWLNEVGIAFQDAKEALPFSNGQFTEKDLFHLSSMVCLKFRGIKSSKSNLKRATEAALSSYVATKENAEDLFDVPQMSFTFCYVASHLGLGLLECVDRHNVFGCLLPKQSWLVTTVL